MSELSERLLARTSSGANPPALLVLEDGTAFSGTSCGAPGEVYGEICFNTSLVGYLEVISDPSYAGQIVTMTYPQIGNYGVNPDDLQRDKLALRGFVVHDLCRTPSNWRSTVSLADFLRERGVVAIEGVDTRALVRHMRDTGAQRAVLSTEDRDVESLLSKVRVSELLVGANLAATVSCDAPAAFGPADLPASQGFALAAPESARYKVVAYDCGAKDAIMAGLVRVGCEVVRVPWNTPAEEVLAMNPDGVFLSNGPGDPDAVEGTYSQVQKLLGQVPVFGICLGHQMMGKAAGATVEKLKFGHRGGNHPVMNLRTHRVEITAQNHGFAIEFASLGPLVPQESDGSAEHAADLREWVARGVAPVVCNPCFGRVQLTHVSLNDGTCEGVAFLDIPAFSVQYHPEAAPGPTDAHYLFTAFARLMEGRADYLDIDIAADRLDGWNFGVRQVDGHSVSSCHPERAERVEGSPASRLGTAARLVLGRSLDSGLTASARDDMGESIFSSSQGHVDEDALGVQSLGEWSPNRDNPAEGGGGDAHKASSARLEMPSGHFDKAGLSERLSVPSAPERAGCSEKQLSVPATPERAGSNDDEKEAQHA